ECLVLVPEIVASRDQAHAQRFELATACRLLDERRMLDGSTPERVHIVVYTCDARSRSPRVAIAYAGTFRGSVFESPATGFVAAQVRDLEGLNVFLRQADDLLEVRPGDDGSIHLAGRRYATSQYAREFRRIDAADLAAIRRSRGEIPGRRLDLQAIWA